MANEDYDLEVARFQRVSSVRLAPQEALALQRGLELERDLEVRPAVGVHQLLFCPDAMESPIVRALLREDRPQTVTLQVEHRRRPGLQVESLELPPAGLRLALRGHTARELLPSLPEELEPVLFVSSQRVVLQHRTGWFVHVDTNVCYHPVDFELGLTQQLESPLLAPVHEERGAVLTVWEHAKAPEWLMAACDEMPRYDFLQEGLSRLAAAEIQSGRSVEVPLELEADVA